MDITAAKEAIKKEFIESYYEWLKDEKELTETEYGRKYGWGKAAELHADNLKSVYVFQKYIFAGRYLPAWVKVGFPKEIIWQLHKDGFLSYTFYQSYKARITGTSDFYYINQKVGREIYKEMKSKGVTA